MSSGPLPHMFEEPTYFHEIFKLPEDLVHTAQQVTSFAVHFVDINQPRAFQFQRFLDGINNYSGKPITLRSPRTNVDISVHLGNELTMDKFQSNTVNQQNATVSTMVDKIVDYLRVVFGVTLSDDIVGELSKNIEETFTDLKTSQTHGWANSSKSSSSRNSWQYRLHFAFPNPDLPNFFYSGLATINVEADIEEESSWWGLRSNTQKNFSAAIDAMELIVQKGFEDPMNSTA
ncbi:hypothetical protein VNI00_013304 [Paramarasmius palmivorus]|uniref:Uncharacterized protein n=1 Tax=Paramarasmius palmivorus TaxID=297713 RepID=A0AAW0BZB6_9AGAR